MKNYIKNSEYVIDAQTLVLSKPGYGGIPYSEGDETELRIANIIEQATDITVLSTELRQHCTDWPSLYHLSGMRANILRPFAESLTGDILEIGAGCGAITRYLGERGANVLALEGSPRRAAIARSRTRDLENVTVMAEKFDQLQCEHQFGVITLIGVLEYANLFTSGENPHLAMLERVRSLLKPDGKLIIAIENQLGLKYFAGAPEDHLGVPMYGIEGRYRADQPQTFGRKVLAGMLDQAGFSTAEFLAPFPDYKLPASIITEEGFANKSFDAAAFAWQSVRRDPQLPPYCNFSLELAWPEVFKNGMALDVANSYLIITSPKDQRLSDTEVLAYHYSTDRVPQYCKETRFEVSANDDIKVVYKRVGAAHQKRRVVDEEVIDFDCPETDRYSNGKVMSWEFIQIVTRDGWTIEEVGKFLKRYISVLEHLLDQAGFTLSLTSSDVRLPGKFLDLVPQNIIILTGGSPVIIDTEWSLRDDVELGQLLFRGLLWVLGTVTRFGQNSTGRTISCGELIQSAFSAAGYALTDEDFSRYIDLESAVQEQVTGNSAREFLEWHPHQPLLTHNLNQAVVERDRLNQTLGAREEQITSLRQLVEDYENSNSWRLTKPARIVRQKIKRIKTFLINKELSLYRSRFKLTALGVRQLRACYDSLLKVASGSSVAVSKYSLLRRELSPSESDRRYKEYIDRTALTEVQETAMRSDMAGFTYKPLFSIVVPVYNVKEDWLREMIESVLSQIYPHWELCLADDASTEHHVRHVLEEEYHALDKRIKVVFRPENGHISKATNSAMEISSGEFYCLLDNDDLIPPEALFEFAKLLNDDPSIDMIYSDEDKITVGGRRYEPFFKPDWSPEYLESCMYTAHFACYRKSIADQTGWFRSECNGAQDYDFVLRFVEKANNIQHIPKILYHWRAIPGSTATSMDSKDYVLGAAVKGLTDMTIRRGESASVKVSAYPGCFDIRYKLKESPLVSIIIPTAGKKVELRGKEVFLLKNCISSVLDKSSYKNIEFIVIDNGDLDSSLINFLKTINCKMITYSGKVNIAKKINMGAIEASGKYLLILNDDIEVISEDWLEAMLEQGQKEGVGVVGAKLLFAHGGIQHVGVSFCGGLPDHVLKNFPRNYPGYLFNTIAVRNWMAVTGACMLTATEIFNKVGGYGEEFRINYNDIDYCLKVYSSGYRIVYTPHAELFHFESVSREASVSLDEIDMFLTKWGKLTSNDPYYNEEVFESRPLDFFLLSE